MELNTAFGTVELYRLTEEDIPAVLALCKGNPLFYRHCPPAPSREGILADMAALPPGKTPQDKYYLGIRKDGRLAAVWDLILGFPDDRTAFWGFFMVEAALQGQGFGSALVTALCGMLAPYFDHIRLGFVSTNPQSRHFWLKNGFVPNGAVSKHETYEIVYAQKELRKESKETDRRS